MRITNPNSQSPQTSPPQKPDDMPKEFFFNEKYSGRPLFTATFTFPRFTTSITLLSYKQATAVNEVFSSVISTQKQEQLNPNLQFVAEDFGALLQHTKENRREDEIEALLKTSEANIQRTKQLLNEMEPFLKTSQVTLESSQQIQNEPPQNREPTSLTSIQSSITSYIKAFSPDVSTPEQLNPTLQSVAEDFRALVQYAKENRREDEIEALLKTSQATIQRSQQLLKEMEPFLETFQASLESPQQIQNEPPQNRESTPLTSILSSITSYMNDLISFIIKAFAIKTKKQ